MASNSLLFILFLPGTGKTSVAARKIKAGGKNFPDGTLRHFFYISY